MASRNPGARAPTYQQQTRTPQPSGLERLHDIRTSSPVGAALVDAAQGGMQLAANVQESRERNSYLTSEKNIAQQRAWEADQLRELETAPVAEVGARADKLLSESNVAWSDIRTKAGEGTRVRHTVDLMSVENGKTFRDRVDSIRARAHGGLVQESIAQSVADRSRQVEADDSSYSANLAEATFMISKSLTSQEAQLAMARDVKATLSVAATRGFIARNPHRAAEELRSENPTLPFIRALDPETRARVLPLVEKKIVDDSAARWTNDIARVFRESGPVAGGKALLRLEQSGESEDVKDAARSEIRARNELLRSERRQEHANDIVTLSRALATDTTDERSERLAHRLYSRQALSLDEYSSVLERMDASTIRRAKLNADANSVSEILAAGLPLDPAEKTHREMVNNAFAAQTSRFQIGDDLWLNTAKALATRTRMLPERAISWTRSAMRSPNVDTAARGAQFFGALKAGAPDALSQFDDETKAFAGFVNSMIENGTSLKDAVETARANVFEIKAEARSRRQEEFKEHAKSSNSSLASFIDRDFDDGLFSAQPGATQMLGDDFQAQAGRYYTKVGDITLARQLAWEDLSRVYGPSSVNGSPMLMAFPPERFGLKPDEIRTRIGNLLKGNPQSDGSSAADITIIPDALTLRQVSDALSGQIVRPTYKLQTKTGDLVLDTDGFPIRFTIPGGEEMTRRIREAQAAATSQAQAKVAAARHTRESIRKMREDMAAQGAFPGY